MWLKIKIQVVIWKLKSHWKSNYFKIIFKIILKYSLYRSNFDVFCLLAALAIILDCPFARYALGNQYNIYIYIYFFFNSNVFVSIQVPQLFRSKWLNFSLSAPRDKISHFDLKSWVTGEIIIRPSKVSNWIMYESIWLSMLSQFDSQCWANLTLNIGPSNSLIIFNYSKMLYNDFDFECALKSKSLKFQMI